MRANGGNGRHWAATALALLGAPVASQHPGVDVMAYGFEVTIPDSGDQIGVVAWVGFNRSLGAPDTLSLNLVGMTVARVGWIDGTTAGGMIPDPPPSGGWLTAVPYDSVPFVYDGRILRIALGERPGRSGAQPHGAYESVVIEYHGTPADGLIIGPNAHGRRAVFGDNWPERARHWLATIDHPGDKASVSFLVRAPTGWRVVAPGRGASIPGPLGRPNGSAWWWTQDAPIPTYTMVIGATDFTVSRHRPAVHLRDTVPVEVWSYSEDSAYADSVPFRRATAIVETMQRLVGRYPYANLKHVQSSTRFGGMENATAVFYAERPYVERRMGEGVVRHETAHQWFGDAVTPASWEHLWLSEGFATYFDGVIAAALDGDSALVAAMRRNAERYFASGAADRPVVDAAGAGEPMTLLNANSYQKGAWILHMLRGLVGDSAFFRGVREYYATYRDSSVTTDQFRRVLERHAGTGLGWFFRQWLERPGHPRLEVRWQAEPRRALVRLTQRQPAASGLFRLPLVTLELRGAGGETWRRTLALERQELYATFDVPFTPTELRVDPDGLLLLQAEVTAVNPTGGPG